MYPNDQHEVAVEQAACTQRPAPGSLMLTRPCGDCPFRSDHPVPLSARTLDDLVDSIEHDRPMWCHATLDYGLDEPGDTPTRKHCAGAIIFLLLQHESLDAVSAHAPIY